MKAATALLQDYNSVSQLFVTKIAVRAKDRNLKLTSDENKHLAWRMENG